MSRVSTQMEDVFSEEAQAKSPNVVGAELARLADVRPDVIVVSADMGAALGELRERHPDRYIDLGIAETNTISVAAGLAATGWRVYVVSMAPFGLLKCAEQIRTDLAATMLPVRIVTRLSGLAMGFFGVSHHGIEDLAIGRSITNLSMCAPSDALSTLGLLRSTVELDGPLVVRVSEGVSRPVYDAVPSISPGRSVWLREGSDVTVIATGVGVAAALDAAEELAGEGIAAGVLDAAWIKPFDEQAVVEAARRSDALLTVEEHHVHGGLGTLVAEVLGRHGISARLDVLALPDEDLEVGVPAALLERYGLTGRGVAERVRKLAAG
ncbi:MAG TPA: transketolase C-terminal domain-containing protein [Acidimicrobiales bacterium]|nr:transketolase C-terminal domain-containing protein [Acidimicrobiales bacterium]